MDVIINHNKEWKILSSDYDFILNVFKTKFEVKLFCDQNNHNIIKNECFTNCLECKKNDLF